MGRAREFNLPNVMLAPDRAKEGRAESLNAADLHLIPFLADTAEGPADRQWVFFLLNWMNAQWLLAPMAEW